MSGDIHYQMAIAAALQRSGHVAGLTTRHFQALEVIFRAKDGTTIQEISERINLHRSGTSRLVEALVGAKLVERVEVSTDRRKLVVTLSEAGNAARAEVDALAESIGS